MLLNYLQTNRTSFLILLPIIGGLLWGQMFYFHSVIIDSPFTGHEMPLHFIILEWLNPTPLLSIILGFSLVMLIAFLITRLNKKYMIIEKRTYLLPLLYIIFSSYYIPIQFFHPGLLATIFMLFAIDSLFNVYKNESSLKNIFNASLYLSLGSLFYFNLIYFIVFIWAGMIVLQPFRIKEFFKSITGVLIPYFFCWSYYFLIDKSAWFIERIAINFVPFERDLFFDLPYYVFFLFQVLFVIVASLKLLNDYSRLKIGTRKYFILFFWIFLIAIVLFMASPLVFMEIMPIVAVPLSFLATYYFITTRSFRLGNIIVVVGVIILIGIQIFPFLI